MSAEDTTIATTPGRRERRKQEVRERLVQAAIELFGQRGFQQTTVEDITEAADVGKGTFFNYFPSKEHVLGALVEIQINRLNEGLASARSGRSSFEVFRELAKIMPRLPGRSRVLTRSMLGGLAGSETVRKVLGPGLLRGREVLAEVFRIGQQRGEIRSELDPHALALAFQQTMFGTVILWATASDGDLASMVEHTFAILWSGIKGPNSPQQEA